jgi:hypothetical protein
MIIGPAHDRRPLRLLFDLLLGGHSDSLAICPPQDFTAGVLHLGNAYAFNSAERLHRKLLCGTT